MARPVQNCYCTASVVQALRQVERFSSIGKRKGKYLPKRKGKYLVLRTNTKPQHLIKYTEISYSIAALVFRKFLCLTYRNGLNQGTSKLGHSKYLRKYEPC